MPRLLLSAFPACLIACFIACSLAACAASDAGPVAAPVAGPAPVTDTIGGRRVESLTIRQPDARAVVVFEAGSRGTIRTWGTVPQLVSRDATVFAYNRPGYGNSSAAVTPRDGRTIVEELRQVLRTKGLQPPYVLVGHSLGGLYMQLFARAYPQEVQGIVLVESLYPRMVKKTAEFPLTTRLAARLAFSRTVWQEIERIDETGEAVLALDGIDDKPMIRLVNVPQGATAIPVDFGAFRMDADTRAFVKGLYPKSKRVVADASHQMQLDAPALVAEAIREVLAPPKPVRSEGERHPDHQADVGRIGRQAAADRDVDRAPVIETVGKTRHDGAELGAQSVRHGPVILPRPADRDMVVTEADRDPVVDGESQADVEAERIGRRNVAERLARAIR